jgi:Zn-dependent protease
VAVALGDDTPEQQGRLTLSPLAHIDPLGMLLFIFARFGWAKPVQINPSAFKHPKRDDLLVTVAGPLANLVAAVLFALLTRAMLLFNPKIFSGSFGNEIFMIVAYFVWTNLVLTIFNFLPIPPLDGSHLLFALIPERFHNFKEKMLQFGGVILIAIVLIENNSGIDFFPIGPAVQTVYDGMFKVLGI